MNTEGQGLERKAKDLPMRPGKPQRQEFEYIRHGTQTLIASFDVASGQIIAATVGNTRILQPGNGKAISMDIQRQSFSHLTKGYVY